MKGTWKEAFQNRRQSPSRSPARGSRGLEEQPALPNPGDGSERPRRGNGESFSDPRTSETASLLSQEDYSPDPSVDQKNSGGAPSSPPQQPNNTPHLEVLRKIRFSLEGIWSTFLLKSPSQPRSLLVCGATRGEGATFISFHLSLFLCVEYGLKVLFVDTAVDDPRSPSLYNGKDLPGLASFYFDKKPLNSLILSTGYKGMYVLPSGAGSAKGHAGTILFRREPLIELLEYAKERFDLVIFDGQPVLNSPSMLGYARAVDQVVLVCRYAHSRREVTQVVVEKMREIDVSIAGMVVNQRVFPIPPKIYKLLR